MATVLSPAPVKKPFTYQSLGSLIAKYPGVCVLLLTYIFGLLWLLYKSHWNAALFQDINAGNIVGFLTPLIVTAAAVLLVGIYLAIPWIEANSPGLATFLGPIILAVREWGNTVVPTPGQVIRG